MATRVMVWLLSIYSKDWGHKEARASWTECQLRGDILAILVASPETGLLPDLVRAPPGVVILSPSSCGSKLKSIGELTEK